jgi:hypothetical protein
MSDLFGRPSTEESIFRRTDEGSNETFISHDGNVFSKGRGKLSTTHD